MQNYLWSWCFIYKTGVLVVSTYNSTSVEVGIHYCIFKKS